MFIVTTCRGKKAAFVPQDISCFVERGDPSGHLHVYVRGDTEPFPVDATFEEFEEMYTTALSHSNHGHISNFNYTGYSAPAKAPAPAVCQPPSQETPKEKEARLNKLSDFQQYCRALYPSAYVFVRKPDGSWIYNTNTAVTSVVNGNWQAYGEEGEAGWVQIDDEILRHKWGNSIDWLNWQASMFYGQRQELPGDAFEPFAGREP